ncbi:MAG: AI-2E family transporter, partial [Nitrospinae bacterium]|nr:AI-2E family transporter [Nitrospinota bacterium]
MYLAYTAAFLAVVFFLKDAIIPFLVAFLVAYALNPLISWMENKKIPRAVGVLLLLAFVAGGAAGLVLLAYPTMMREAVSVAASLPDYAKKTVERIGPLLSQAGTRAGFDADAALKSAVEKMGTIPLEILKWAYGVLSSALSSVTALAGALLGFLIVPVAAFYLLLDYSLIRERFYSLIPPRHRETVSKIIEEANNVLASYIRGQMTVVFTLATIFSAGLAVIGAPMPLFLGILSGVANVVPYMPLVAGLLPSLVLTYLHFGDPWHPLAVLALYGATQAFEGLYLTPKIMGNSVGLHPVAIMMAVF